MKKNGNATVFWWIGWIVLTIASFFLCSQFWTDFIAKHAGPMSKPGVPILWVATVFGSWMALLVPLIIIMYNKVDRAYEDARLTRESKQASELKNQFSVKSISVDLKDRRLSKEMALKLKAAPFTLKRGHLVTVILRDGRRIENVFVLNRQEVLGVYGVDDFLFKANEVVDLIPADVDKLPQFTEANWLRLDGALAA